MKILKQIIANLFWIILSFVSAFVYARVVLGPKPDSKGFWRIFDFIYFLAREGIGLIGGLIIALIFIPLNIFYLRKKLNDDLKGIFFRFLILLFIAVFVSVTHHILEKVVDVI